MIIHQNVGAGIHFSAENKFLFLDSSNKLLYILYRLELFPINCLIKFIGRFLATIRIKYKEMLY